jgi:hypothetical protein
MKDDRDDARENGANGDDRKGEFQPPRRNEKFHIR